MASVDRLQNWTNRSVLVVQHLSSIGLTGEDILGHSELVVQLRSEPLDLAHEVVLGWSVQLSDSLCTIGVSDTVLRTGELFLNRLSPGFCLLLLELSLDHVWKLNDDVQLTDPDCRSIASSRCSFCVSRCSVELGAFITL